MNRPFLLVVVAAVALAGLASLVLPQHPLAARAGKTYVLEVGDRLRVQGEAIGCRATRLAQFGKRVFVDCRRSGPLAGTYGTLIDAREVMVVHFRGGATAKIEFTAKHEGGSRRCG